MTLTDIAPYTRTTPRTGAPSAAAPPTGLPPALGGTRGLIDGGLPPLVFVAVNAVAAAQTTRPTALVAAIGAAAATGLGIVALRLIRKEPVRQALGGLAGLPVAVVFAATSGEARGFFLPGILVDAAYGAVFAGSAGATTGATIHACGGCSSSPPSAGRGCSPSAGVQAFLYREDLPGLFAVGKLLLGWPLTVAAFALTLAAVRRATRRTAATA